MGVGGGSRAEGGLFSNSIMGKRGNYASSSIIPYLSYAWIMTSNIHWHRQCYDALLNLIMVIYLDFATESVKLS
jgi:hypothetical protein